MQNESNSSNINPFQSKGFIGLVVNFYPLLEDMTRRGIPMNVTSLEKLDAEIDIEVAKIVKRLDEIVPSELKGLHPKEGYKRVPKEVKDAIEEWMQAQNPLVAQSFGELTIEASPMVTVTMESVSITEIIETDRHKKARESTLEEWIYECTKDSEGVGLVEREFVNTSVKMQGICDKCLNVDSNKCIHCQGLGILEFNELVKRYCRILAFNPNSSQQVSNLMKHYGDDKLAKQIVAKLHIDELDDGDLLDAKEKASPTNKVVLRKLGERTGREVYGLIVDMRELIKVKGTFIAGWMPDKVEEVEYLAECGMCKGTGIELRQAPATKYHFDNNIAPEVGEYTCMFCNGQKRILTLKKIGRVHPQFSLRPATGQLNSYKPNCFSDDTEILTLQGWQLFKDLCESDVVAQFNPESGIIDFVFPDEIIIQDFEGDLLHIKTEQQIDMLVTSNHNCLVQGRKNKQYKFVQASEYPEDFIQPCAGTFIGGHLNYRESQLILLAALQADGTVRNDGMGYQFNFAKQRKIDRLRNALDIEGITYSNYDKKANPELNHQKQTVFYIPKRNIPVWWELKKRFSDWILDLDKKSFEFLSEEVFYWDGLFTRKNQYASKEKINTDWVQILQILTNKRAKIRRYESQGGSESWQLDVVRKPYTMTTNREISKIPYKGKVYCVTVPTHCIIVRRNGKVAITGNSQNQIKHSELGKKFRNCIEAYPQHTIVEFDMAGYHALMMGFLAKDLDYIRLCRIDIHSYVTGWIVKFALGVLHCQNTESNCSIDCPDCKGRNIINDVQMSTCLALSDKNLKFYLKCIKELYGETRTKKAKPILLGRNLGLSVYGAFERYKDDFMPSIEDTAWTFRDMKKELNKQVNFLWSKEEQNQVIQQVILEMDMLAKVQERREKLGREEVKKIYTIFDTIFPKPVQWQKTILKQANEDGYLKSAYGFIRRFWNVEEPVFDRFGNFTGSRRGEQAEQALAQLIQNSAFGHMRQIMLELERLGYNEKYGLINTIHDSIVLEVHDDLLEECLVNVKRVMETPSKLLVNETMPTGFVAQVEVMVGKRFGELKEVHI